MKSTFALALVGSLLFAVGCGGGGISTQSATTPNPGPVQPEPVGSNQFSWSGYTWQKLGGDQFAGDIAGVNSL